MKVSGVYKITNTVTGDFYIGSSKDVKRRWTEHKCKSTWNRCPNNPLYKDMKKYCLDKFSFQILEEAEPEHLKEAEQQFIETLQPTYNNINAKGFDVERRKETNRKANNKYNKSNKGKESHRKANNKYNNQLCFYNGETLTLSALRQRLKSQGFDHPTQEAKKYLI